MKKILLLLVVLLTTVHCATAQQQSEPHQPIKITADAQALNFIGNFSNITYWQPIGGKWTVGATLSLMHNRAEIEALDYKKIEHRFKGYNIGHRLRYNITLAKKLDKTFVNIGTLNAIVSFGYMNTTYRTEYREFMYIDQDGYRLYDVKPIRNDGISCIDVVCGFNLNTPVIGNLFVNSTAGLGAIMMTGFNKNDLGAKTVVRPNYLVSLGLGYTIRKRNK